MKTICYLLVAVALNGCTAEKLLRMAESKKPELVMSRGEELAEKTKQLSWPDTLKHPLVKGSYESEMQDRFKVFSSNTCGCIPSGLTQDNRDFVPSTFRSINPSPYFNRMVEKADRISGLALFYYPFSQSELVEFDKVRFDQSKLLFTDYYDLTIPLEADKNFTNFFYSSSCSNYLFSALDGEVSSPVPIASIKAGLRSDNQKQATLICIGGNFKSPLIEELQATNNEIKTNIYFKLWDYFSKAGADTVLYVLRNFEGVTFNTTVSNQNAFLVNTNGQLNLSAGFASVAAKMEAGRSKSTFFKGVSWTTLIDKEDFASSASRANKFMQLPTPSMIVNHFAQNVRPQSQPNDYDNMYQNYEHTHSVVFKGIPESNRNSDDWEVLIDKNVYRSTPTLEIDKNHFPENECKFIIKGIPNDDLFGANKDNTIAVSYKIKKKNLTKNKAVLLNVDNMVFTINKEPLVYDRTVTTTASEFSVNENRNNITYKWHFNIRLLDSRNLVRYNAIPSPTCYVTSKELDSKFAFTGEVNAVASNKDFSFTISSTVPNNNLDRRSYSYTNCSVKFSLYINNQAVDRTFNLSLPMYSELKMDGITNVAPERQ